MAYGDQASEQTRSAHEAARAAWVCLGVLAASGVLFHAFPEIDLALARWFYSAGVGFPWARSWPIVAMRSLGIYLTVASIVGLLGVGIWWRLRPHTVANWPSNTPLRDWWFIAAAMALGPGIIVNLVAKPLWGRPRPVHLAEFGGHDHFTAAWAFSSQCRWNCSFFSGEACAAAFFMAFALIVPARWRMRTAIAGVIVTLAVSFARMAAGGHFLSDVVTGWLVMALIILVLRAQIYHGRFVGPVGRWLTSRTSS